MHMYLFRSEDAVIIILQPVLYYEYKPFVIVTAPQTTHEYTKQFYHYTSTETKE